MQGCRKCRALKEGDHPRTDLVHSAECRACVAEILADDVGFQTRIKEGERRFLEPSPKVQVGVLLLRHLHIPVQKKKMQL